MLTYHRKNNLAVILIFFIVAAYPVISPANHSWGNYHWARTSNPFTLRLGDNLTSAWSSYLGTTSYDWSLSAVLDTMIVPGLTRPKICRSSSGRVEVCNYTYGRNGWLGVAQIWTSGSHIVQGVVKINDTYFNTATYNSPAWRNLVMCQEIGHTLGLDHQDEDFNNAPLGTCMDYSNDPLPNQHPNDHDYVQLEIIYSHNDAINAADPILLKNQTPSVMFGDFETSAQWGKLIRSSKQKRTELYELDLASGQKMFTFVIWAEAGHADK